MEEVIEMLESGSDPEHSAQETLSDPSRRNFLKGVVGAGVAALTAGCTGTLLQGGDTYGSEADGAAAKIRSQKVDSLYGEQGTGNWGAMYFPSDAYNAWQTWARYDEEQVTKDIGYAAQVNLDSVRVILSYEYWRDNPQRFEERFDHFIRTCDSHGIDVLPVLFEAIGKEPTQKNLEDTDPETAYAVQSPSTNSLLAYRTSMGSLLNGPTPQDFTRRMAKKYGDDVMALEIMNEPVGKLYAKNFADRMLRVARKANPEALLTMGSREIGFNDDYSVELDIYQFHHNVPPTKENMQQELKKAKEFSETHGGKPILLTEYQLIRGTAQGDDKPVGHPDYPANMEPNYEELAPMLREAINDDTIQGAYMWGLMVKPAYLDKVRKRGRFNGLYWETGEVYDLDDAQAIAGNDTLELGENTKLPPAMERFY